MNLGTLDLSTLPPVALWCLIVIVLVCHVLPDAITLAPSRKSSPQNSPSGPAPTQSPAPVKTTTP